MMLPGSILLLVSLIAKLVAGEVLPFPVRAPDALGGSMLVERLTNAPLAEREEIIAEEVLSGNVPAFLRNPCAVELRKTIGENEVTATVYVTPDYLAIGSDEDYI